MNNNKLFYTFTILLLCGFLFGLNYILTDAPFPVELIVFNPPESLGNELSVIDDDLEGIGIESVSFPDNNIAIVKFNRYGTSFDFDKLYDYFDSNNITYYSARH